MDVTNLEIRGVEPHDAEQLAAIYAHHVLTGTASYDTDPPSIGQTLAKIERIGAAGWPFVVATVGGQVAGYAYATQFRDRAAYRYTCENSVYVHPGWLGRGIGTALMAELIARCRAVGFRQMIAVVGGAEPASVALHRSCGFDSVGRLRSVGWKKGRWLETVYMQLELAPQDI